MIDYGITNDVGKFSHPFSVTDIRFFHRQGTVSVIPLFDLLIVHLEVYTEIFHLVFRKSHIRIQWPRIGHGEFIKHIQRRVGAIFLYGKDAGHVRKRCIRLAFEQVADKIQIDFLGMGVVFVFSENAVPFVDDENKSCLGL